jgi:chemotaxis protein methyltransferase CheR
VSGASGKEYVITDEDFANFSNLIYKTCGIHLKERKRELLQVRLSRRLKEKGIKSFQEYYQLLISKDSRTELVHLINAIATNLTSFFREPVHFDYLTKEVFPKIFAGPKSSLRIRFWSAGCSSGEEPYSLAMTLLKHLNRPTGTDIKILGTDISTRVLKKAISGIYPPDRVKTVSASDLNRFFKKFKQETGFYYRVKDSIRNLITFRQFNLMDPFPFKEVFDIIFCRNVMIYFDRIHQQGLVHKFYHCLKPGGLLLIGHSESLTGIDQSFEYIKPTIYRK